MIGISRRMCAAVVVLLTAHVLHAQTTLTTGTITGVVQDVTGARIRGADVVAELEETHRVYRAVTDRDGRFAMQLLPIGRFEVRASASGFEPGSQTVTVTVGASAALQMELRAAGGQVRVEVNSSDASVADSARTQIAQTIDEAEIGALPVLNRSYFDVALLTPGVAPTNTNSTQTFAETSSVTGQGLSVNSQRNFSNSFVVDGLSANDDAAGVAGNVYTLDTLQAFQVVTSGGQAEVGRAMGGYFNVVTRSGTNNFHGSLYGYLQNQRLNASNALAQSKLPVTQTQYGATLSGPLKRDRTFFFLNGEARQQRGNGVITIRPGDAVQINTRLSAVGYPAPRLAVSGATTQYPTAVDTQNVFVRGDHRLREGDDLSARYSLYRLRSSNSRGVGALSAVSNGTRVDDTNHTVAISNVAQLSARSYNETRAQFVHDTLSAPPNDEIGPTVTISGVATLGRFSSSPTGRVNTLLEGVDNFITERGAHTLKAGLDVLWNRDTITFPQTLRGSYTFSSLANFLSGTYNTQGFTQSFGTPVVTQNNPNAGFYLQDSWNAGHRVTVNLGLRYDLEWLKTIATDTNNVSPRVGFAWSPFVSGRTVVRASYGLYFDRVPLRPLANALLSAGNTTDASQARLLSYTFSPGQAGAPTFPNVAAAPPSGALVNFTLMNRNMQNAYAQQASAAVEQQLGKRSSLELSYQHLRGLRLITSVNANINADGSRPNPTVGNVKVYSPSADSYYDGLAIAVQQRAARYGMMRLSYTWSKSLNDVGEFFFSSPINNFYVGEDRGRSDDDQRHRLVFYGVLNSPRTMRHAWVSRIASGWQMSGTLQYYSRLPFNIVTGTTTRQGTTQRPCINPSLSYTADNACTRALPGSVIGRNLGVGFDFVRANVRLERTFALREAWKLQAAAQAFNTFNHRNDMLPNGTWGTGAYPTAPSATFGRANGVGDPRNVELLLRLNF